MHSTRIHNMTSNVLNPMRIDAAVPGSVNDQQGGTAIFNRGHKSNFIQALGDRLRSKLPRDRQTPSMKPEGVRKGDNITTSTAVTQTRSELPEAAESLWKNGNLDTNVCECGKTTTSNQNISDVLKR